MILAEVVNNFISADILKRPKSLKFLRGSSLLRLLYKQWDSFFSSSDNGGESYKQVLACSGRIGQSVRPWCNDSLMQVRQEPTRCRLSSSTVSQAHRLALKYETRIKYICSEKRSSLLGRSGSDEFFYSLDDKVAE